MVISIYEIFYCGKKRTKKKYVRNELHLKKLIATKTKIGKAWPQSNHKAINMNDESGLINFFNIFISKFGNLKTFMVLF